MPEFKKVIQDGNLCYAILVDIDGTIAEKWDRSPFDWSRVSEDGPHHDIIHLVELIALWGYEVIFVSGRSEDCRKDTEIWLMEYFNIPTNLLFMRKSDDKRKDSYVKYDILQDLIKSYNICYAIDDRDQVVKMWRESGIRCLQVAEWNF